MNHADIQHIVEFSTRVGIPLPMRGNAPVMTPRGIAHLYDCYVSTLSKEKQETSFMNYGYWEPTTAHDWDAQANLLERVVVRMTDRSGKVLDAACGMGATTRYLLRYWLPEAVVATNISWIQMSIGAATSDAYRHVVADAASMCFADAAFTNIICIEAAFHFHTRECFLRECVRMLRPNGLLAVTDIIWHDYGHHLMPSWLPCNFVPSIEQYKGLYYEAGFSRVDVVDITEQGWNSYARRHVSLAHEEWSNGKIDFISLQKELAPLYRIGAALKHNLLCFAVK